MGWQCNNPPTLLPRKVKVSQYQRNKREILKEKCLNYLGGKKCKRCSDSHWHIACYDFHHKKGVKEENISKMIDRGEQFDKIKKELDKCAVLCKNCHAEIHALKLLI